MRTTPKLSRFLHFPVTAGIGLMAIGVTLAWMSSLSIDALTMNVLAFEGEPWRILTSALPHVGLVHLLFNLTWLWPFGSLLEETWGAVRTLAIFALFGVTSALGEYALSIGGVGLSGVVYGLWGLLAVLARRDPRFAGIVTRRMNVAFIAWFFFCILMTVTNVMAIGNVAHGVGAVTGVLLGVSLSARKRVARIAGGVAIAITIAVMLLGATLFRPLVNLSKHGGSDSALLGYELVRTDPTEAIRHLRHSLELSPDDASTWFNLGGALEATGSPDESLVALRRAFALEPDDRQYRERVAAVLAEAALAKSKTEDFAGALPLYRESLVIAPTHWTTWYNLSLALAHVGDASAAVGAARKAHELAPSPDTRQWLVDALIRAGRQSEADEVLPKSPVGSGQPVVPP